MTDRADFGPARRALFDRNIEVYGDGRPGYPPAIFDLLAAYYGLGPGTRVLEIGAGTGQATGSLLDAGAVVTAVELGSGLAQHLLDRFGSDRLSVLVGEFETVELPAQGFDLVVAATAFHWIEPDHGLARVAQILRPGGSVALWWNCYGDPARPDPLADAMRPLLRRRCPQFVDNGSAGVAAHPYALDVTSRMAELERSGLFDSIDHHVVAWTATQTANRLRAFLSSFSPWMDLDESIRNPLLGEIEQLVVERFGGEVERPFLTTLFTGRRI